MNPDQNSENKTIQGKPSLLRCYLSLSVLYTEAYALKRPQHCLNITGMVLQASISGEKGLLLLLLSSDFQDASDLRSHRANPSTPASSIFGHHAAIAERHGGIQNRRLDEKGLGLGIHPYGLA
jgi:hypothetical protein